MIRSSSRRRRVVVASQRSDARIRNGFVRARASLDAFALALLVAV